MSLEEKFEEGAISRPLCKWVFANKSVHGLAARMVLRENKSVQTFRRYTDGIKSFVEFLKVESADRALEKLQGSEDRTKVLDDWITFLMRTLKLKPVSLKAHYQGLKKWLFANRVSGIDWEFLSRPKVSVQIRDRIPTKSELRRIFSNRVTLRDKAYFMALAVSGLRVGTLASLQVRDYSHYRELGKLTVNGGARRKLAEGQQYYTFVTPEVRELLDHYLASRGKVKPTDPLFVKERGGQGEQGPINEPMSKYSSHITRQWYRLLKRANLHQKIEHHKYPELHAHTLRKFFQTTLKLSGVKSSVVDFLMGHHPNNGEAYLDNSYFRPTIESVAEEYRKALVGLTILETNLVGVEELADLKAQVQEHEQMKIKFKELIKQAPSVEMLDRDIKEQVASYMAKFIDKLEKEGIKKDLMLKAFKEAVQEGPS